MATAGAGIGPGLEHVTAPATRGEAGHQQRFDHVAGEAGILADEHAMTSSPRRKIKPAACADLERQFRA